MRQSVRKRSGHSIDPRPPPCVSRDVDRDLRPNARRRIDSATMQRVDIDGDVDVHIGDGVIA